MKLLIVLVTYQRLAYTKRTLKSLINTIDVSYNLAIVDNNSTDGTQDWLAENGPQDFLIINPDNFYPGKATNIGWAQGLQEFDATHLMRCDNDMEFVKGWASKAEEYFEAIPSLGQLGLDNTALDTYNGNKDYLTTQGGKTINLWPGNVGGPCIISRKVWDDGLRYHEAPWHHDGGPRPTAQEDARLSMEILIRNYKVGHPTEKLAWTFADESNRSDYPDYYKKTMKERGYEN